MSTSRNYQKARGKTNQSQGSGISPKNRQQVPQVQQMKKVGDYLIDLNKMLGKGQYGKVYLSQEMLPQQQPQDQTLGNSLGDQITQQKNNLTQTSQKKGSQYCACKVVERADLCKTKEGLVVSEIQNQDSVESQYVVKLKKAIKTDARYYMFMEYCNGGDLKDLMEIKKWNLGSEIIQTIMKQLVQGFNDMISVLVIHRDLKLQNIMLHFPDDVDTLMNMNQEERFRFIQEVDLTRTKFEVKIADFGFSKKLKSLQQINQTICGTPLYMAPQVVQKTEYSYKADIWSLGVILFEMLNGTTPFHAENRAQFEGKVEKSRYNLKDHVKKNLTLECILFLSQCLQHNENERRNVGDLIEHPYIIKPINQQQKLSQSHIQQIFKTKQKRSHSTQPEYIGKDGSRRALKSNDQDQEDIKQLYFNAKDKEQLENIKKALKGEHDIVSNNTFKDSSNTKVDTSNENFDKTFTSNRFISIANGKSDQIRDQTIFNFPNSPQLNLNRNQYRNTGNLPEMQSKKDTSKDLIKTGTSRFPTQQTNNQSNMQKFQSFDRNFDQQQKINLGNVIDTYSKKEQSDQGSYRPQSVKEAILAAQQKSLALENHNNYNSFRDESDDDVISTTQFHKEDRIQENQVEFNHQDIIQIETKQQFLQHAPNTDFERNQEDEMQEQRRNEMRSQNRSFGNISIETDKHPKKKEKKSLKKKGNNQEGQSCWSAFCCNKTAVLDSQDQQYKKSKAKNNK